MNGATAASGASSPLQTCWTNKACYLMSLIISKVIVSFSRKIWNLIVRSPLVKCFEEKCPRQANRAICQGCTGASRCCLQLFLKIIVCSSTEVIKWTLEREREKKLLVMLLHRIAQYIEPLCAALAEGKGEYSHQCCN